MELALVEQITLARNRDQHPDEIVTMRVSHARADLNKYPRPFFMSEVDQARLDERELEHGFLMNPRADVSPQRLEQAITETERLASWLEECLVAFFPGDGVRSRASRAFAAFIALRSPVIVVFWPRDLRNTLRR